jgi:hypothetical protein
MKREFLLNSLSKLRQYCKNESYKGWDPFDGLNSEVFRKFPTSKIPIVRLTWLQLFKFCPINLRKMVIVKKGYNSKGLSLLASGFILAGDIKEAESLLVLLQQVERSGYSGKSWGYNFPWQARAFYLPIGKPNIVTTSFVANAFLDYAETEQLAHRTEPNERRTNQKAPNKQPLFEDCLKVAQGCCEFMLHEIVLFEDKDTLCFGYTPGEEAQVHNANMLGAAILARVWNHTNEQSYLEKSRKAMAYSVNALNADYSWRYGELSHHKFIDNFHTGFNLVALKDWMNYTGDNKWKEELKNAYEYFLDTFWLEDGCPKYYHNSLYPIDIHCSAQGIVTCLKLKDYDDRSVPMANKIAKWAIDNMQDESGYFYYQKTRWYTNKISYMRWSQAWMFYALAYLTSFQEISSQN